MHECTRRTETWTALGVDNLSNHLTVVDINTVDKLTWNLNLVTPVDLSLQLLAIAQVSFQSFFVFIFYDFFKCLNFISITWDTVNLVAQLSDYWNVQVIPKTLIILHADSCSRGISQALWHQRSVFYLSWKHCKYYSWVQTFSFLKSCFT